MGRVTVYIFLDKIISYQTILTTQKGSKAISIYRIRYCTLSSLCYVCLKIHNNFRADFALEEQDRLLIKLQEPDDDEDDADEEEEEEVRARTKSAKERFKRAVRKQMGSAKRGKSNLTGLKSWLRWVMGGGFTGRSFDHIL